MLIYRVAGRLQQEHVFATHILANLDKNLPITKIGHINATQLDIQILADPPCQLGIRTPCEESQVRHDWYLTHTKRFTSLKPPHWDREAGEGYRRLGREDSNLRM